MPTAERDGATEKLLHENSQDLERLSTLSDRDTSEHARWERSKRWGLLLQISCTLGAIFLVTIAAYLSGVRLVLAENRTPVKKAPSVMPDCESSSLLLKWADIALQRQRTVRSAHSLLLPYRKCILDPTILTAVPQTQNATNAGSAYFRVSTR